MTAMPATGRGRLTVRVSVALSCGCATRPSAPLPAIEATSSPGAVVICDRCQEYAVVLRVTQRLHVDRVILRDLLVAADIDETDAASIAAEQVSR